MLGSTVALGIATLYAGWHRRWGCDPFDLSEGLSVFPGNWPFLVKECRFRILSLSWPRKTKLFLRDRRAANEEKYLVLRETIATATGATVSQAALVTGMCGSLCESEWRSQLELLKLSASILSEICHAAVLSAVRAAGTTWRIRN